MDTITTISTVAKDFFTHLGIDFSNLEVLTQEEEKNIYNIHITSPDSSILIGPHGKTLLEMQGILAQILENVLQKHCLIHLEVNDYLAEKQRRLFWTVDRKVELARKHSIDQVMYELSAYERKQVHAYINECHPEIETKSIDGEKGRELHITLKKGVHWINKSMDQEKASRHHTETDLAAIDLDGINI